MPHRAQRLVPLPPPPLAQSIIDLMIPLDYWLYFNGFGSDFFYSALVPMLTPLFVTQHGNSAQSAGATTNHFSTAAGFLSFNASEAPPTFHTIGGSQFLYERMAEETAARTPNFRSFTNTEVTAVAPSAGGWNVFAHPRAPTGGGERPDPLPPREYDEVILGVNAHIAAAMIANGGDGDIGAWPSCASESEYPYERKACRHGADNMWRAFRHWALRNTEYEWSEVTLSAAPADDPNRDDALYHIWEQGVMTGSIDRILDVGEGDYKLRVAPVYGDDTTPSHIAPDVNPPLATRRWQHHRFNLWEHVSRAARIPLPSSPSPLRASLLHAPSLTPIANSERLPHSPPSPPHADPRLPHPRSLQRLRRTPHSGRLDAERGARRGRALGAARRVRCRPIRADQGSADGHEPRL